MNYFIDKNFKYEQYRNKSVLIIGGGPSTDEVQWEKLEVDYKWSCTNFFMNLLLQKTELDLVALGNLQDYRNNDLLNYLDTYTNCKVLFETNYLYPDTLSYNQDFVDRYNDRIFYGQLDKQYTGIVGPPARLITLAANLGFKDVYFVGIDGFDPNFKNVHSFTKEEGLREGASHNSYDLYYGAHTSFGERIYHDFGDKVNFYNLGEIAESHNIIKKVSQQFYPLSKQLHEKLK